MPFQKGNTIGQETRFKKGQVANPAGRPPDKLRRFIHAELDKIGREATDKQEAATKLQVLAERIVEDAISGCIPSRKMLVDRLYPALSRHEIATAQGEAIQLRWENEQGAGGTTSRLQADPLATGTELHYAGRSIKDPSLWNADSDGRQLRECRSRVIIKTPKCVSSDTL